MEQSLRTPLVLIAVYHRHGPMTKPTHRERGVNGNRTHLSLLQAERLDQLYYQVKSTARDAQAIGAPLEAAVRDALTSALPERYAVTSGYVVDFLGGSSRQTDCIIYDKDRTARLPLPSGDFAISVDDALAIVEVKTTLTRQTFVQALQAVASAKGLARAVATGYTLTATGAEPRASSVNHPLGIVFAYRSSLSLSSLARLWHDVYSSVSPGQQADLIIVLTKGFLCLSAKFPEVAEIAKPGYHPLLCCSLFAPREFRGQPRHGVANLLAFIRSEPDADGALIFRGDAVRDLDLLPNTAFTISACHAGLYSWDHLCRWLLLFAGYEPISTRPDVADNAFTVEHWPLGIVIEPPASHTADHTGA